MIRSVALVLLTLTSCGGVLPSTTCKIMGDLNEAGAFIGMTLEKQIEIQHMINARISSDAPLDTTSDYSCVY